MVGVFSGMLWEFVQIGKKLAPDQLWILQQDGYISAAALTKRHLMRFSQVEDFRVSQKDSMCVCVSSHFPSAVDFNKGKCDRLDDQSLLFVFVQHNIHECWCRSEECLRSADIMYSSVT